MDSNLKHNMPSKPELTQMPPYTSRTADKFVVRLPDGLRERINEAAENNHRSMNGEIVARIDGSMDLERKYEEMRQLNSFLNQKIAILEAAAQP
jgi:hypothetical protein